MFVKISIVAMITFSVVNGEPIPQYGVPFNNGGNNIQSNNYGRTYDNDNGNGNGNGNGNDHSHDHAEPKAYEFGYQVKDDYTGNNYNRQEKSDGNQVTGEYRVQLPDGRMQIVTYYADWQTGYHADVRYEGEAQFPDQYNNNNGYNQYNNGGQRDNQYNNGGQRENQYNNGGQGDNQYNGGQQDNRYNDNQNYNGYNYNAPATSQVTIKGLSNPNNYNQNNKYDSGYNFNAINDGLNFGSNYDNYRSKNNMPSIVYGAQ